MQPIYLMCIPKYLSFTDTSIQENKTYEYYVKVFYSNGDISNPSTSVIVETK